MLRIDGVAGARAGMRRCRRNCRSDGNSGPARGSPLEIEPPARDHWRGGILCRGSDAMLRRGHCGNRMAVVALLAGALVAARPARMSSS
jgi:hypothetical protein